MPHAGLPELEPVLDLRSEGLKLPVDLKSGAAKVEHGIEGARSSAGSSR